MKTDLDTQARERPLRVVILGLSITSAWGNAHAGVYRGLVSALAALGHDVLFLERDAEWAVGRRDLLEPPYGHTALYMSLRELKERFGGEIRDADLVVVGSQLPEGINVGRWVTETARGVTAFYDIDTPATLARLASGGAAYISRALIPRYQLYLSLAGGEALGRLAESYGATMARPLYGAVDTSLYYPEPRELRWDLGYVGTYSSDRQPTLERLMLEPVQRCAGVRCAVVGQRYPEPTEWPSNVARLHPIAPAEQRAFYNSLRFTLNITRTDGGTLGFSPSLRLLQAAACGTPIISDYAQGLEQHFRIGEEILVSDSAEDTLRYLLELDDQERIGIGQRARARVLAEHTAQHRAEQLVGYVRELRGRRRARAEYECMVEER